MASAMVLVTWLLVLPAIMATRRVERADPSIGSQSFPTSIQKVIVDQHNRVRLALGKNLGTIQWDDELAKGATAAATCENWNTHTSKGENLAMSAWQSSPDPMEVLVKNGIASWVAESSDYNHETRVCKTGKTCGHYTQMIWGDTYAIGCGYAMNCRTQEWGAGWDSNFFLVCRYKEVGNMEGKTPYRTMLRDLLRTLLRSD